MELIEVKQNLFSISKDYALAHCISADYALGAGIAKEFAKRGVKQQLEQYNTHTPVGKTVTTHVTEWLIEFNLVTKEKYWQKPTYETVHSALIHMKLYCNTFKIKKLAMPRIGCGLDKLEWSKVKDLIIQVFKNMDIEILICYL